MGNGLLIKRAHHHFRLIRRHYGIFSALKENDRAGKLVRVMYGRPGLIGLALFRPRPHERVKVSGLKLVRVSSKRFEIAYPVRACAGLKALRKGEHGEGGVAPGTSAANCRAQGVDSPHVSKVRDQCFAIPYVGNPPLALQSLPIFTAISRAAGVVEVCHRPTARCVVLNA